MKRLVDWESRLLTYIRSVRSKPFVWGRHDCFIFSCSAIEAMTGIDLYSEAVGKYTDEKTAKQFCKDNGYKSHTHYLSKHFKYRPSVLSAMRGDVVIMKSLTGGGALGICQGASAYGIGEAGIYAVPLDNVRKVFEI